ncbi:MAG: 3-isopropylmalate dehydrogenase [Myxococcota bacterium]
MTCRIALLPGDGIGPEVLTQGRRILEAAMRVTGQSITFQHFDFGAEKYLREGITLPDSALQNFRENFDAIYLGALGDPRVPDSAHAKDILLGMRFKLDLFINLRPVRVMDEALCPLKHKRIEDVRFTVFRENTEGEYTGVGGIFKKGTPDEIAIEQSINTRKGVERIIVAAFEYARKQGLKRLCMADKHNAWRHGHDLWLRVFKEVAARYPEITPRHLFVDALVMELVRAPEQFDVIVTCNLFGDIVTDLGAQLQGGMGMAISGNIHPGQVSMFEPVHGSAPDIAGKNRANPMAAVLTGALMLQHLGYADASRLLDEAVEHAYRQKWVTPDLGGTRSTVEVGDALVKLVEQTPGA